MVLYIPSLLYLFLQILVFGVILCLKAKRRKLFWLRFALFTVAGIGICWGASYIRGGWWFYIIPFICNFAVYFISFKISWFHALLFAASAYSMQNLIFNLSFVLQGMMSTPSAFNAWLMDILIFPVAAVYWLFVRKLDYERVFIKKNFLMLVACAILLVLVYVVNSLLPGSDDAAVKLFTRGLIVLAVALLQWIIYLILGRDAEKREKEEILGRLEKEQRIFDRIRENIEVLNLKYHDLKYFLRQEGKRIDEKETADIKALIDEFDSFTCSGNPDLDVVLTEKRLQTEKADIIFDVIADGKALGFLSHGEIYSLFGNLLDNAVEYLKTVADKEKRTLNLYIKQNGNFVGIQQENYCAERLEFENGLPKTKKSKDYHGFGLKSVKYIVEKHNGNMLVEQNGDMFTVNIMFPL